MSKQIICWWSGGITSAVACKKAIEIFGQDECRVVFIDTHNEDNDTYRFKDDCEKWYGVPIETITGIGEKYEHISDVWRESMSLNTATGAICSTNLKRRVREKWQKDNPYKAQVFGYEFDAKEFKRAQGLHLNNKSVKAIFPLLMLGLSKSDCYDVAIDAEIKVPDAYLHGFRNNNCLKTGCVQGGIGYWKKMQAEFPDKFQKMADMEHELTFLKGQPVTMLKDQSNEAKRASLENKTLAFVFLQKHPKYPQNKCIDDMEGRPIEPLNECNGFCGANILTPQSETVGEINWNS
jgi:Phosphoadenosine phosphosulfate reductase family